MSTVCDVKSDLYLLNPIKQTLANEYTKHDQVCSTISMTDSGCTENFLKPLNQMKRNLQFQTTRDSAFLCAFCYC